MAPPPPRPLAGAVIVSLQVLDAFSTTSGAAPRRDPHKGVTLAGERRRHAVARRGEAATKP